MNKEREEKHFGEDKKWDSEKKKGEVSCLFTASTNTARRTRVTTGERDVATHTHSSDSLGVADTPNMQDGLSGQIGRHLRLATGYTPLCRSQLVGPATNPRDTHKPPCTVLVSYPNHYSDHKVGKCCDERHAKHVCTARRLLAHCPERWKLGPDGRLLRLAFSAEGFSGFRVESRLPTSLDQRGWLQGDSDARPARQFDLES